MGMVGLIIALPLTTLIISYYKRFVLQEEGLPLQTKHDSKTSEIETKDNE